MNAGDFFPNADVLNNIAHNAHLQYSDKSYLPAVLYGNTDIVDNEGRFLCHRRLQPPEKLTWRSFKNGMLVCHQAFYARVDIAKEILYNCNYRYSADVDWCIRVMKEAGRRKLSLLNVKMTVVNYTKEGQTTIHHRDSLKERYYVMCEHYGKLSTIFMHIWFVVRQFFK